MSAEQRSAAERLRRDIADLERLMVDMPPHHAGGTRRATEERIDELRRTLHRMETGSVDEGRTAR